MVRITSEYRDFVWGWFIERESTKGTPLLCFSDSLSFSLNLLFFDNNTQFIIERSFNRSNIKSIERWDDGWYNKPLIAFLFGEWLLTEFEITIRFLWSERAAFVIYMANFRQGNEKWRLIDFHWNTFFRYLIEIKFSMLSMNLYIWSTTCKNLKE